MEKTRIVNHNSLIALALIFSITLIGAIAKNNSDLKVVEKPKNDDGYYKGSAEYVFNDGVIIRHSWDGGIYAGYKDYDHDIEVAKDAGHEFDQKSLSYGMQRSRRL
jgi:hypothetical protein